MSESQGKLIHIAFTFEQQKGWLTLYLRKVNDVEYRWFRQESGSEEVATDIAADTPREAIRLARRDWKPYAFRTLMCGYRFTLPERDEIGSDALFHHMVASYSVSNGVYFDEELGHQCIVREISQQAHDLWKKLKSKP